MILVDAYPPLQGSEWFLLIKKQKIFREKASVEQLSSTAPSVEQLSPTAPSVEQLSPTAPSVEQLSPTAPSVEQLSPTAPVQRDQPENVPDLLRRANESLIRDLATRPDCQQKD